MRSDCMKFLFRRAQQEGKERAARGGGGDG